MLKAVFHFLDWMLIIGNREKYEEFLVYNRIKKVQDKAWDKNKCIEEILRQIAEILLDEDPVESIQRYAKIFSGNCENDKI